MMSNHTYDYRSFMKVFLDPNLLKETKEEREVRKKDNPERLNDIAEDIEFSVVELE